VGIVNHLHSRFLGSVFFFSFFFQAAGNLTLLFVAVAVVDRQFLASSPTCSLPYLWVATSGLPHWFLLVARNFWFVCIGANRF
jgi:hypothetical protein